MAVLDPAGAVVVSEPLVEENPGYFSLVSSAAGKHTFRISSSKTAPAISRVEFWIDEMRTGREADRLRIASERNCLEAARLRRQFTPESDRHAVELLQQALVSSARIGDRENTARIHCRLGDLLLDRSRTPEALVHYEASLRIGRESGDERNVAEALARIGLVRIQAGNAPGAIEPLEQALKSGRELGDKRTAALALANLGEANYWMGRQREAVDYYREAVELWRATGERRGLAQTLHYLGSACSDLSDVRSAFLSYGESLELWRAIGDRHGEALTLTQLGALYDNVSEKQEAINRYRQASRFFRPGADPFGEAILMSGLALAYYSLGDLQTALDYYRRALRLHRAARSRDGEAGQLLRIGEVLFHQGEYKLALEHLQNSLAIYEQIQDRRMIGITQYNIGRVQRSMGDSTPAIDRLTRALKISRDAEDPRDEALILDELGQAYAATRGPRQWEDYSLQALRLNQRVQNRFGEVQSRYNLARAYREMGNATEAMNQIGKSILIVESLRTKVDVPSLRVSYFSTIRRNYDLYVDLLMDSRRGGARPGQDAIALQVSERARARNLLDLLEEARAGIRQSLSPLLAERETVLLRSLNAKAQHQAVLMSGKHSQSEEEKLAAEISALNVEYDQLQAEIRTQSPRYASLTQPQPLSVQEIQKDVLDDDTLLLEYSLGDEHSYLWAVGRDGMTSHELPARERLENLARKVRELLTARQHRLPSETASRFYRRTQETDAQYRGAAAELSRDLIGPVAGRLGTRRLLVVADGILQYLPFGALPVPDVANKELVTSASAGFTPLVAEHEIVNLPSATALAVLRRQIEGRRPAELSVAVLADPVFRRDDPRLAPAPAAHPVRKSPSKTTAGNTSPRGDSRGYTDLPAPRESPAYSRLLFSGREAEDIASIAAPGSAATWVGTDASREKATSRELARYRIAHFATHGVIDDTHPNLSGIVLSMYDAKGREQDGFLRLHDVYNLNLPVELVVLSACNTGLGKDVRGEGLIGLVRGFMYAGVARVVASLWRVDDQSTAELMKLFYQGVLKENLSPAAALRAAQVAMSRHERWSAPYYWAGFVLQGEYR